MIQLKAGYFTDALLQTANEADYKYVKSLLKSLTYFDVDTDIEMNAEGCDPAIALIHNILSRGTPAPAPQFIEDILSTTMGKTLKRISKDGNISREIQKQDVKDAIIRALHIIEPRQKINLNRDFSSAEDLLKNDFLKAAVRSEGDYIVQIAEFDKKIDEIIKFSESDVAAIYNNIDFGSEKADLCFAAPYADCSSLNLLYEFKVDGFVDTTDYISEDTKKEFLKSLDVNGKIIVNDTDGDSFENQIKELQNFTQSKYFDSIRNNYNSPLYTTEEGSESMQIALTPAAVARVQKIVLQALNSHILSLDNKEWNIAVIERDVPCAFLAIEDLKQKFTKFFVLENKNRKFPKINLEIFQTEEFGDSELNLLYQGSRSDISEFDSDQKYDLLIDISILQRFSSDYKPIKNSASHFAVVKSSKSPSAQTQLLYNHDIFYNINIVKENEDDFNDQEEALTYFFKELFAKNGFKSQQIKTIEALLNGRNVLCATPPATGKSTSALFAALMKPGYSFVLPPSAAAVRMQFKTLRDRHIDTNSYLNPALTDTFKRNKAVDDIVSGRSPVTFISPALIHDKFIRNIFKQTDQLDIPVYNIYVDEAQRISIQTSQYNPEYQDIKNIIGQNFKEKNISSLRIGAFTSSPQTEVCNEAARKLESDIIVSQNPVFESERQLKITEIKTRSGSDFENIKAVSRSLKQKEVEKIISDVKGKSIVFSHETSFDETDTNGEYTKIAGKETLFHKGDIDDKERDVTNWETVKSERALQNFQAGDNNVLAATYSAASGININNLKQTICFELPETLEEFYIAGRIADKQNKIDILFNTGDTEIAGRESVRDDQGNLYTVDNLTITTIDAATSLQRLEKRFPGPEKEKIIIRELLNGVFFPPVSAETMIEEAVFTEFGISVDLETEPMVNPYQIHVYEKNHKSLGYLDFKTGVHHMPESVYDADTAEKIQNFIFELIVKNSADVMNFLSQMEYEPDAQENNGIQNAADAIHEGEKSEVIIPFYNNEFFSAAQFINKEQNTDISGNIILRCYNSTFNFTDFARLLKSETGADILRFDDKAKVDLQSSYLKFRNKSDTLRAISRLKEIDLIDDYLTNDAESQITVYLTKYNKDRYKRKLLPVLEQNLTKEKTLKYMQSIDELQYLSLEKYSDVLIDFFYAEIYGTYKQAIQDCSTFFKTVLKRTKEGSLTADATQYNLLQYFNSKYKCAFVQNAIENPRDMREIISVLESADGNVNELRHLLQSSESGDNEEMSAAKKIISGYCKIFTCEDNNQQIYDAFEDICKGLTEYRFQKSTADFESDTDAITDKIIAEDFDLKQDMQNIMILKLQRQWLEKFNSDILKIS